MNKRDIKINKLPNSAIEIIASISIEELETRRPQAIKNLGSEIKIDGYRTGHIPEEILIKKIGEMPILNEMAELALADIYPIIILENNIKAIGRPEITITKMAPQNPLEFKAKVAIMPEFKLPDYKKIAKKINEEKLEKFEVTDEEMENTLTQIRKMNAIHTDDGKEPILPELNLEMVQKLGDFKDLEDFKIKLKEDILKQKEIKNQEIKRVKMMDAILEKTDLEMPEIITESEIDRMLAQTKSDITRMGLQFNKYLEHLKKTEMDLRNELKPEAEKRSKIQLILDSIIAEEKITPNKEEADKAVEDLMKQNPELKKEQVVPYVQMVLSNQEVFKLLEKA
ncbi:MAG: trigger factor [Patescibacteria group bacterium]